MLRQRWLLRLPFAFCATATLTAVSAAPTSAQQPVPALTPMAFLAGHCWKGTFPQSPSTDEHCFDWMYGGAFLRDRHTVSGGSNPPYHGETIFAADGAAIRFRYHNSAAQVIDGSGRAHGDSLVFDETIAQGGEEAAVRTVMLAEDSSAYRVIVFRRTGTDWTPLWTMRLVRQAKAFDGGAYTVHTRATASGAYVTSHVVETARHVLVFDGGASGPDGDAVRALAEKTGKSLAAVFVTHAHADHYGGVARIRSNTTPLITTAGVARHLAEWDAKNYARFGATLPGGRREPDRTLGDGETLTIDGVTITAHEAGPGEAYADSWYLIEGGGTTSAIVGDLAMYGIPPFAQSGHTADWLLSLAALTRTLAPDTRVYIGHDARAAGGGSAAWGPEVLLWQAARVRALRDAVLAITAGGRLLTDAEVRTVVGAMHTDAPDTAVAFDFLIETAANVVAAELISERQKDALEAALTARLTNRAGR